jgi:CRP-like cAMP-binding protein
MPKRNRLLAALPESTLDHLKPHMKIERLKRGTILHRPGERIRDLYFPIDCMISITITSDEGKTAEAGAVGSREMVGINAFMGGHETTQTQYIAQIEGDAVRIPANVLKQEFDNSQAVRDVLLKYTQAMIAHLSQNVACNRLHDLNERLARWILEVRDRVQSDDFHLTHEFMSQMLGVRRSGITIALRLLEAAGILEKGRNHVRILDLEGLKEVACACYETVTAEYDRLLGPVNSRSAVDRQHDEL